jgi:hypothetical protein
LAGNALRAASAQPDSDQLAAPSRRADCGARFRAARPVTFFVLAKKVSKERRAHETAPSGFPVLLARAGGPRNSHDRGAAHRATCFGQSRTETPASAALLVGFEGITPKAPRCGRRGGVSPLEDAAAVRGSSGAVPGACLSDRRERVSRTARWCPAAQGKPQAGLARSPFFGDFLWRDKESHSPPGDSRLGRSSHNSVRRAAARSNTTAQRSSTGLC